MIIKNVTPTPQGVIVEYLTSGIDISTLVTDDLSPQEIVQKGFDDLKPCLLAECERLDIELDEEIPTVTDEVISIDILGVNDYTFIEGQTPIEQPLRCVGKTKFNKTLNLTTMAKFEPSNPLIINPTETSTNEIKCVYGDKTAIKGYTVTYKTKAEVEAEAKAEDERRKQMENAEETDRLLKELDEIDKQSIRPLRASAEGTATQFDRDKLTELDTQAQTIRKRLSELKGA